MPRVKKFKESEAIDRALQLFWDKGYHATSIQDLVDELKINRASMYASFNSKHQLYLLALQSYSEVYLKWWSETLYFETTVRSGIVKLFEYEINLKLKKGTNTTCFVVKATTELFGKDKGVSSIIEKHKAAQTEMLVNYLNYGVNQGQISPYKDVQLMAQILLDLINGVSLSSAYRADENYITKQTNNILSLLN